MGWTNQYFTTIIIEGPNGTFTGLFAYVNGPAKGNLYVSVTNESGTDPFGNSYQSGVTVYNSAGDYVSLGLVNDAPVLAFNPANGTNITSLPDISSDAQNVGDSNEYTAVEMFSGSVNNAGGAAVTAYSANGDGSSYPSVDVVIDGSNIAIFENDQILVSEPVLIDQPEPQSYGTWTIANLVGDWGGSLEGQTLAYHLYNDNTVGIYGRITSTSNTGGDNVEICTLNEGYYNPDQSLFGFAVENGDSPYTGISHMIELSSTGVLGVYGVVTANNTLTINVRFPLDYNDP